MDARIVCQSPEDLNWMTNRCPTPIFHLTLFRRDRSRYDPTSAVGGVTKRAMEEKSTNRAKSEQAAGGHSEGDLSAASDVQTHVSMPPLARMAVEIPRLRNHQDFQRACVILYQADLNDPHLQEYGRNGQNQSGIDLLGCRNGDPDLPVAVQCRRVEKPLKKAKIEDDCRKALILEPKLTEIIFATTAPDDAHATDAARQVEKQLREEGHKVRVVIYGWGQMQIVICKHPSAYAVFNPASVASNSAVSPTTARDSTATDEIIRGVLAGLNQQAVTLPTQEPNRDNWHLEDPALHARIDVFRDLFKNDRQIPQAKKGLERLLEQADPTTKPWARFRVETNLGSIAMELGLEKDATAHFEAAHAIKPEDGSGLANLAMARTIAGRYEEAIELGRRALAAPTPGEAGIAYLIQATERSGWIGDPNTLVPHDLVESLAADLGLADFLRRREEPGWEQRVIEIAERHRDAPELEAMKALAILSLAVSTNDTIVGGRGAVSTEQLQEAADTLVGICDRNLEIGFAQPHDVKAYLNNAAVVLRLLDRHIEAEALLHKGISYIDQDAQLRRLLALSQVAQGKRDQALGTLADDDDPESMMLRAELLADSAPDEALKVAAEVVFRTDQPRLEMMRQRMIFQVSLRVGKFDLARAAASHLRSMPGKELLADFLDIKLAAKEGTPQDEIEERLAEFAKSIPNDVDFILRFELADTLDDFDQPALAADLLKDHVDLNRLSGPTRLYIGALARARRDEEYHQVLSQVPDFIRNDPDLLWGDAAHHWNLGDLDRAKEAIDRLLEAEPRNSRAILLRLEIFMRRDQTGGLLAELEKPLEDLNFDRLKDGLRVARLLAHFGQLERGCSLAYRLFLSHRDASAAWMTLSAIVLEEGRTQQDLWTKDEVDVDAAVNVRFEDGEERFVVVEPNPGLRRLDPESVEPDHPLIARIWKLSPGAEFVTEEGRKGTIVNIRHKFVARFHYILDHHQDRFPKIAGFQRVTVDTKSEDAFSSVTEMAKARRDWIEQEKQLWLTSAMPLAMLARRLNLDVIEVAGGVVQSGQRLRVAMGNDQERQKALEEIQANGASGCTMELHSFWTAWRLKTLDTITKLCGQVHVAQTVLDELRQRREEITQHCSDGFKSAGYENGKLTLTEVSADVMQSMRDDVDAAIIWLETNAKVCSIALPAEMPESVRDLLRQAPPSIFDGVVVAVQTKTLLISDDLIVRQCMGACTGAFGVWSQIVLQVALNGEIVGLNDYVRLTAHLIEAGHAYIGTNGVALATAAAMDAASGERLGYNFRQHASTIGGAMAEVKSHFAACRECLSLLWTDAGTRTYREPVTGHLLERLLSERYGDYPAILRAMIFISRELPELQNYLANWITGHFIPLSVLQAAGQTSKSKSKKRRKR